MNETPPLRADAVATAYDPAQHEGKICWLWARRHKDEPVTWRLAITLQRREALGMPTLVRFLDPTEDGLVDQVAAVDRLRGAPCLPVRPPRCEPSAGVYLELHSGAGSILTMARAPGRQGAALARDVIAAAQAQWGRATS